MTLKYGLHVLMIIDFSLLHVIIGKNPAVGCRHLPQSYCKVAKLTEGDIEDAFQAYYIDSDKVRQDTFIMTHVTLNPVFRRRTVGPAKRERTFAPTFKVITYWDFVRGW